jgi:nicotinamidase-related amidase
MRYSAFFGTSLDNILRELKATSLVITGIVTNICIQHTVAGAFFRGYEVTIPQDCVEAFTEAEQKEGLEYIKRMYGSNIVTLEEGLKLLGDV